MQWGGERVSEEAEWGQWGTVALCWLEPCLLGRSDPQAPSLPRGV